MSGKTKKLFFLIPLFSILGYGNAGIPIIIYTYPGFIILLLPIIFIEYLVIKSMINNNKKILKGTILSNLFSTLLGVPLAWGCLLGIELAAMGIVGDQFRLGGRLFHSIVTLPFQSAWLAPSLHQEKYYLYWMFPVAVIINLIPAYFLSKYSEYFLIQKIIKDVELTYLKKAVFRANNITYAILLVIFSIGYFIYHITYSP